MKIRLTYRVEAVIEGDSIEDIKEKWHNQMPVPDCTKDIDFDFVEMNSIEDADTYADMTDEWTGWNLAEMLLK